MSKQPCENLKKVCAVNVTVEQAAAMLEQLALPIEPRDTVKRKRERAVARSGLTPSKGYRLWYGQVRRLWDDEVDTLLARWDQHIQKLEQTHTQNAEQLRALREAREMRERHYALEFSQPENLAPAQAALGRASIA